MEPDVIVIGAGVAGLEAATELARQGWRVLILEARDRLGGRILSVKPAGWKHAVELGAEFVHDGDARIRKLFSAARRRLQPVEVPMWTSANGVLTPTPDFWSRIGAVAGHIPLRDHGWSFDRFLRERGNKLSAADRTLARAYVGSFNAAATGRISAHALRPQRAGADANDFKPTGDYAALVRTLARQLPRRRVEVRLRTRVTSVRWEMGQVDVRTQETGRRSRKVHRARAVVCTLPLGVLKAGDVTFSPRLRARDALVRRAGWGNVVRIVIRFRRGFWKSPVMPPALGARDGRGFGFVTAYDQAVPVWWALQAPTPVLTGWAGGKSAERFARASGWEVMAEATRSLAHILGTTRAELMRWVADWAMHDWRNDPFTRGAYSYPVAGADDLAAKLAAPVHSTLFFAGEACAADFGTVHGALASGHHAGRQAAAALEAAFLPPPAGIPPVAMGF